MGKKKKKGFVGDDQLAYMIDFYNFQKGKEHGGEKIFGKGFKNTPSRNDKTVYKDKKAEKTFKKERKKSFMDQLQEAFEENDVFDMEPVEEEIVENPVEETRKPSSTSIKPVSGDEPFGITVNYNTVTNRVIIDDGFAPYTISLDFVKGVITTEDEFSEEDLQFMTATLHLYMMVCSHPVGRMTVEEFVQRFADFEKYDSTKFLFAQYRDEIFMFYMGEEENFALFEISNQRKMTDKEILELYADIALSSGTVNNIFYGDREDYVEKYFSEYDGTERFVSIFENDKETMKRSSHGIVNMDEVLDRMDVFDPNDIIESAHSILDVLDPEEEPEEEEEELSNFQEVLSAPSNEIDDPSFDLTTEEEEEEDIPEVDVVEEHSPVNIDIDIKTENKKVDIAINPPKVAIEEPEEEEDDYESPIDLSDDAMTNLMNQMMSRGIRSESINEVQKHLDSTVETPKGHPSPQKETLNVTPKQPSTEKQSGDGSMVIPVMRRK